VITIGFFAGSAGSPAVLSGEPQAREAHEQHAPGLASFTETCAARRPTSV